MSQANGQQSWNGVIDFWFPEGLAGEVDANIHSDQWFWRMRGGADSEITTRFEEITTKAAEGTLAQWSSDPLGRLALIIVLDQFSRSVWRGTPRAYAQDTAALVLSWRALRTAIMRV